MIQLISSDFDGTLIGHAPRHACPAELGLELEAHAARGGIWVINTGRSLEHIIEGLEAFTPPVQPDFLVVNERHIHCRENGAWGSLTEWNTRCDAVHAALREESRGLFDAIRRRAADSEDITIVEEDGWPVGLVTCDVGIMDEVAALLDREAPRYPGFSYQRNEIYLRFCHTDWHKGAALAEVLRLTGIPGSSAMAVGDQYNDLSMLDGTTAALTACPCNAVEAVKHCVRASGGFVSARPDALGVTDAIRHFLGVLAVDGRAA